LNESSARNVDRRIRYEEVIDTNTGLPKYEQIQEQQTFTARHYMINFKNIFHVNCEKVVDSRKTIDESVLASIVLQLSITSRNELRDKMADYFEKAPEEDRIDL